MKVRLFDILDLSRPLAKAARDFDWTEVVKIFPEASHEGLTATKIWTLASLVVLSELTGLSEGEVLSRWPENPYWQAFSGFDQFQWKTPVSAADCLAFRRFLTPERAAKLSSIAKSIKESKAVSPEATTLENSNAGASVDEALALRQVHFSQPLPSAPYKAPPRPDFHSSVKHTYAKSATVHNGGKAGNEGAKDAATAPDPSKDSKAPDKGAAEPPKKMEGAVEAEPPVPKAMEPVFAHTYAQMFRGKAAPLPQKTPPPQSSPSPTPEKSGPSAPAHAVAPLSQHRPGRQAAMPVKVTPATPVPTPSPFQTWPFETQIQEQGTPQFDTTAPLVLRAPPGEPIRMEVNAAGEGSMRYQWEQLDEARGTSIPLEGCHEPTLTVALEPEDTMLAFQCRVSNTAAPEGILSRVFFIKKIHAAQRTSNTFGEKFDPKMFGLPS